MQSSPGDIQENAKKNSDMLKLGVKSKLNTAVLGLTTATMISSLGPVTANAKDKIIWEKNVNYTYLLFSIRFENRI